MKTPDPVRIDRRVAIKWMLTASAGAMLVHLPAFGAQAGVPGEAPTGPGHGYGTDPDLMKIYKPGDVWALTLSDPRRREVAALCDVIVPADGQSPSASSVGVTDFIDEWVSAPYPDQRRDRTIVLDGFGWLDAEAARRFGKGFADLDTMQHHGICDDICDESRATAERRTAAHFFALFRDLTGGGFYSSPVGRKDLNYIGNVPLTSFEGPPHALLKALGLE
jgi:hypothetical protein